MPERYDLAAMRHFNDAVTLEEHERLANADQLFGFAAECGIKSALVASSNQNLAAKHREHVDRLWGLASLQSFSPRFRSLIVVLRALEQPFFDWSTDHRYLADDVVSAEMLARHRKAAKRVLASVGLTGTRRKG